MNRSRPTTLRALIALAILCAQASPMAPSAGHAGGADPGRGLRTILWHDGLRILPAERDPSWRLALSPGDAIVSGSRAAALGDRRPLAQRYERTESGASLALELSLLPGDEAVDLDVHLDTDLEVVVAADGSEAGFYFQGARMLRLLVPAAGDAAAQGAAATLRAEANGGLSLRLARRDAGGKGESDDAGQALFDPRLVAVSLLLTTGGGAPARLGPEVTPAWIVAGDRVEGRLGSEVATAGDVNGDGFSDVIVGGEIGALVYLGSASGLSTAAAWSVPDGEHVTGAGDVNGDGFDDVVVGGMGARLYLGSAEGLKATTWEAEAGSLPGAVSGAGDVNGDGLGDVLVVAGTAALYLGSGEGLSSTPVWTTPQTVWRAATAGDVNGDGYADVVTAALTGPASTYHGSPSGLTGSGWTTPQNAFDAATAGDVDGDGYSDVIVRAGFTAELYRGSPSGLLAGSSPVAGADVLSVATAGDVNGDGFADVLVGTRCAGCDQFQEGRALLHLGSPGGLDGEADWEAQADQAESGAAIVATAGDVNGDGFGDILVGLEFFDDGQIDEGRAVLYHGGAGGPTQTPYWQTFVGPVVPAGDVDGDGFSDLAAGGDGEFAIHHGSPAGPGAPVERVVEANSVVAASGDFNGDGFSDIVVFHVIGSALSVYHGSSSGLSLSADWTMPGPQRYGHTVACAGDVNGDGFSDLAVGAPNFDDDEGSPDDGGVFVYHGSPSGLPDAASWIARGFRQYFPFSLASAGDVNGDGFSDLIAGAPEYSNGNPDGGDAYVYLGSPSGLSASPVWTVGDERLTEEFGYSVAGAGDVNGDGYGDVLIGAPELDSYGRAALYLGSATGLSTRPAWTSIGAQFNDRHGGSVAGAGDVNGDGYGDVVVGAPRNPLVFSSGRVSGYLGSPMGLSGSAQWVAGGSEIGSLVAAAGDVNGDGFDDILAGSRETGWIFLGGGTDGVHRSPRQLRSQADEPIGALGRSDAPDRFRLGMRAHSAGGRAPVRLEWEAAGLGLPLDGGSIGRGAVTDSGPPAESGSGVRLIEEVTVPGSGLYHWRLRAASTSPLFPRTPWFSLPGQVAGESKLRVGEAARPAFQAIGPVQNEMFFPDSPPPIWSWHRGNNDSFRLEWSRNPSFRKPRMAADQGVSGDVGTFRPDAATWLRILRLGQYPDARAGTVFWRIAGRSAGGGSARSAVRSLRVAPAQAPVVSAPAEGAIHRASDVPPPFLWDKSHNNRFQVRFSASRSIAKPRIVAGAGYTITTGEWTMPAGMWQQVAALSSAHPEGRVYYSVQARDALNRPTWSSVRSIRIIP
ncbi:MAG TPA: VCBS repeat-containing protein [Candidatus Polarisedimenticolia bacterium]|nr:VCBS repeat-containing protein [Candidatus Polarisedimenticolia bacterium]